MLDLGNTIRYHNKLYYEKNKPEISDAEYDRLFASLLQLEGCFPMQIAVDSPTKKVGSGVADGAGKVKHEQPMVSLSSSTGSDSVAALLKRVGANDKVQLLVQPKVDGLPVELTYAAGRLVSASTRGNGRFGEDVTERVREIKGIPGQLTGMFPDHVVVRGEVYADLALMKKVSGQYATPRHFAAGVLQALNADTALVGVLRLFPFELVRGARLDSDMAALKLLSGWGFQVDFEQTRTARTLEEVREVYRIYLAKRDQQPFAMDGIVVKVDDLKLREQMGQGARAPFWAAAWKFPPESASTRISRILWTVGRTGRRTPVAEVEPVRLGGVLVSRVSLQSQAGIDRLKLSVGDQVIIALVGDVIPRVVEVMGKTLHDTGSAAETIQEPEPVSALCLSDSPVCHKQFLAKVTYFFSKSGLGVAGLGRGRLNKMIEAGLVVDLPSLFTLKAEDVARVPGFSLKTGRRLIAAIRAAGQMDSFTLVTALGISGVGPKSVQHLTRQFASLDKLLEADQEMLAALSVKDARTAKTLRGFFHTPGGQDLLIKFRELGIL